MLEAVYPNRRGLHFLDVGAYEGELTAELLERFPESTGMLFEPTPDRNDALRARFARQPGILVLDVALAATQGRQTFYLGGEQYTNSLLRPVSAPVGQTSVVVETVDAVRDRLGDDRKLEFIKTDAQGQEVQVLRGAVRSLRADRPILLVEAMFSSLYEGQDSYYDLFEFMRAEDYELMAISNAHRTPVHMLAFADLLFAPSSIRSRLEDVQSRFACSDPEVLGEENRLLRQTCDERLALIHELTAIAEERLRIMEGFQKELNEPVRRRRWRR